MSPRLPVRAEQARRVALITGASSGIGAAFADVFAAEGFDLVITARREDRLRAVAADLEQRHGRRAEVIRADLSEPLAAGRLCEDVAARGLRIDALVNNAGYGIPGTYVATSWERHATFLQVMVVAVAELTHRLLPGMIERRYGRIVNVASLAGLLPAPPGHTLYAASKAFMVRFSESLAREVRPLGIHVTAVCPGFTVSEFHDVSGMREAVNALPHFMWMDAPTVARQGFDAVMAGTPIYVTGKVNAALAMLGRVLPLRLVEAIGRRAAKVYRRI